MQVESGIRSGGRRGLNRSKEVWDQLQEELNKPVQMPIEELAEEFAIDEGKLHNRVEVEKQKGSVIPRWRPEPAPPIPAGCHLVEDAGLSASETLALIATAAMGKQGDVNSLGAVTHEQIE